MEDLGTFPAEATPPPRITVPETRRKRTQFSPPTETPLILNYCKSLEPKGLKAAQLAGTNCLLSSCAGNGTESSNLSLSAIFMRVTAWVAFSRVTPGLPRITLENPCFWTQFSPQGGRLGRTGDMTCYRVSHRSPVRGPGRAPSDIWVLYWPNA